MIAMAENTLISEMLEQFKLIHKLSVRIEELEKHVRRD